MVRAAAVRRAAEAPRRLVPKHHRNRVFGKYIVAVDGEIFELDLAWRIGISIALFKVWWWEAFIQYGALLTILFGIGPRTTNPIVAEAVSSAVLAAVFADIGGWRLCRGMFLAVAMWALVLDVLG